MQNVFFRSFSSFWVANSNGLTEMQKSSLQLSFKISFGTFKVKGTSEFKLQCIIIAPACRNCVRMSICSSTFYMPHFYIAETVETKETIKDVAEKT